LIEAFRLFDKIGNGMISAEGLRHVMSSFGEKLSPEECDTLICAEDVDNEGNINLVDMVRRKMA
jgi:calmodulin